MKFYSFSNSSDQALEKFMKIGEDEVDFATHQLSQMMLLCDYEIILITPEFPMIDRLEGRIDASLISLLSKAWRETLAETQAIPAADNEWKRIKRIGRIALVGNFVGNIGQTRNKFNPRTTLWRSNESLLSKKFFIFLRSEERRSSPITRYTTRARKATSGTYTLISWSRNAR